MVQVTRRLVIECGAAQTQAALLNGEDVWKFWFGPARGDEAADASPLAGRRFAARVLRVDKPLGAAFADLGGGADGFLPLNKSNEGHCIEGAMIAVEIKSPPRQGKGALLRFLGPLGAGAAPGRLPPVGDPAIEAIGAIGAIADEIIIDDGDAKRVLNGAGFQHVLHESRAVSLFESCGATAAFDAAIERTAPIPGGGQLYIDETQALTAIDVDTGPLQASSNARLREKISFAAASEAARQISLRNIGGHVVIDFPEMPGEGARKRFSEHLRKVMAPLDVSAASFSKSGLYSFTAPRLGLSLLERFTEPDGGGLIAGRRFTIEACAKSAICALEGCLRSAPSARFRLMIGAELEWYIAGRPEWSLRLADRYGARFDLTAKAGYAGRDYDLSKQ